MTRVINSNSVEQLPLATDAECKIRRSLLIASGAIKPAAKADIIARKDGTQVLSTRKSSKAWRQKLIDQGVINTSFVYIPTSDSKCGYVPSDEGEYDPQPIGSESEYIRRKNNYLWMISDILRTRRELRLVLGKKAEDDPDWYF